MSYSSRTLRLIAVAAALSLTVGCGGDNGGGDSQQPDAGDVDANGDNGNGDANGDNGDNGGIADPDDDCEEAIERGAYFSLEAPDDAVAVHAPRISRVGDELWTTFVAEFDAGEQPLQPYLVRLECDGENLDDPEPLTDEPVDDVSPVAIDVEDDLVFTVWSYTNDEGEPRSSGRSFDADGTPIADEPFAIEVDLESEDTFVRDLANPDVAVRGEEGAFVVAEWQIDIFTALVLFQHIDEEGERVEQGFEIDDQAGAVQTSPAVAFLNDNRGLVAYTDDGTPQLAAVDPLGQNVDEEPSEAEPAMSDDSPSVALSKNLAADNTWAIYPIGSGGSNTVKVRSGLALEPRSGETSSLTDRVSQQPAVTASELGGAKAWVSGGDDGAVIHLRRFQGGGTDTSGSGPTIDQHGDDGGATGGPDIVWLTDEIFASIWPEEDGLVGQIIDFELEEAE